METDRKINVLQIVEGFGWGGAEKKLLELVKYLDKKRFNLTICSLGISNQIPQEFLNVGAKVFTIKRKRRIDIGVIYNLVKLIKKRHIDVVMTVLFYADIMGILSARIAGVKAVFSWETSPSSDWLVKRRLLSYRFVIRFCNKVIAVSRGTAQFLVEKRGVPIGKILVIPYGVDLSKYSTDDNPILRRKLGLNRKNKVIGVVARLQVVKGHVYLINAAEKIVGVFPEVKFVFVGDGTLRNELEEHIRAKRLERNFLFLGYRSDIPEIMRTFDIFVLPSLSEGFPNVVLEAMAAGKPVVATAIDGTKEAIANNITGLLVPVKNSKALQNVLLKLLRDESLSKQMGERGRKRVEEYFSLAKQVNSFEKLYTQFL